MSEVYGNDLAALTLKIARGEVDGSEIFSSYGKKETTGAITNQIIWPNGDYVLPPATGVQLTFVSTSVEDAVGGTGIHAVEMHYLDANLEPRAETITITGTTPGVTVATDIRFVQCAHMVTFGTAQEAVGDISFSFGTNVASYIGATENRCSSSARMVPKGKKAFIVGATAGSVSGTAAAGTIISLASTYFDEHDYSPDSVFIPRAALAFQDNSVTFAFPVPIPFPEGAVVAMTATTDKAAIITGTWFGWIEDVR